MTTQEIVSKLWNLCNVLRDDGITYHQYVTELTYILFLKMAKETGAEKQIPEGYRWDDVCRWNVGEIVFNRVRRGTKMDPDLYTTDEIKTIRDQIGFDQDGFITPYAKKITYSMNFKAKNYLYNIPLDEISLNPNLLPQNPGWE